MSGRHAGSAIDGGTALAVGGAKGIGLTIAEQLTELGATVFLSIASAAGVPSYGTWTATKAALPSCALT